MKNKRLLVGLLILPLLLAVPLLGLKRKRTQLKREIARLLAPVPGTAGCGAVDSSLWISNQEVVCITEGGEKLEAVNATTGRHRQLASPPTNSGILGNFGVSVSPDGQWILWPSGKYGAPKWSAMRLDGTQRAERPRLSDNISNLRVAWRPDSRGWTEVCEQYTATGTKSAGGLPVATRKTTLRIYHLSSLKSDDVDVPQASAINGLQVTQKGEAVIICSGPRLVFVSMMAPFAVKWQITPTPPQNSGSSDIDISPRGDRIAWTFQKMGATSVSESIWLSDIKGTTFERITPDFNKFNVAPFYLHWTPDGKALSGWLTDRTDPKKRNLNQLLRIEIPARLKLKP